MLPLGGAERDIVTRLEDNSQNSEDISLDIGTIARSLNGKQSRNKIAKFLVAFDYLSVIRAEDFPLFASNKIEPNKRPYLEEFFCTAGIWSRDNFFYIQFCK